MKASALLLILSVALSSSIARAGEWQVAAGFADEIDGDFAPTASLSFVTTHRFPVEFIAGYIAPRRTDSQFHDPVWYLGADLRYHGRWWFVGGGAAVVNNQSDILSSWYQFLTVAGVRHGQWVLSLRHLSNASTRGRNRGETFLTLGWAW